MSTIAIQNRIMNESKEHRGIPEAIFIEDINDYVVFATIDNAMKPLNNLYGKYKFMENSLLSQKKSLLLKLEDITKALNTINYMIEHREAKEINLHFELSNALHTQATITPQNMVYLWLGANVMLEYTYDEAYALLSKNKQSAEEQLDHLSKDLTFLKEQITVSEVNINRVHNRKVELEKK